MKKRILLLNAAAFLIMVILSFVGCPFYRIFGITCPFCGTSRAWLSFLKMDIKTAFRYNLFFLFVPVFLFCCINFDDGLKLSLKNKKLKMILLIFSGIIFLYNVFRWFGYFSII